MGTGSTVGRPEHGLLCAELVGRGNEIAALRRHVEALAGRRGGVVALVGEAGAGKSRLAAEVVATARADGYVVLAGRAVPGASPVPYRPLTEAFLAAFRAATPPASPALAGFGGHLGRLVPAWHIDGSAGADESPVLLGEAVVRLLRELDGPGCVLVLEDLHWADAETLAVVDYLADAVQDEPVLCIVTARPTGSAADLLARLADRRPDPVIAVEPLGDADVDRMIAVCLAAASPPPEVRAFIRDHAEGVPFVVEELLAGLVASGALRLDDDGWTSAGELTPTVPLSVRDSIRRRLAALDPTARRVLAAAAILGRRFEWDLLPGVAEVDGRAVVDSLRAAVDEQLIEPQGDGFRFRHALTREAVLDDVLPPERRDLARRAWPAVERAYPGLPGPWCELAAELAAAAGEPAAAAERLVESASRAAANGAFVTAEQTARRARRLASEHAAVALDAEELLVRTLVLAGKADAAITLGRSLCHRLAAAGASPGRQADLLIVLARAAVTAGDTAEAEIDARAAEVLLDGDVAIAARVGAVAAHIALQQDRLDDAARLATAAVEQAAATGQPEVECEALEVLGRVARTRDRDHELEWYRRSAAVAERHGLAAWRLRTEQERVLHEWGQGNVEPLVELRALAARHGALVTVAVMDLSLADVALSAFDRAACIESARACVEASRRYGLATLPVAHLWLAGGYALAADDTSMEAEVAQALSRDPTDARILADLAGRVRATRSIVADDRDALRTHLDTMMDHVHVTSGATSVYPNRILWALLHAIDDDDGGVSACAELADAAVRPGLPIFRLALEVVEAIVLGRSGAGEAATTRATHAFDRLRSLRPASGTTHYAQLVVAEAAVRDGWGHRAVTWLRDAEAFFDAGGYELVARRCRRSLGTAGVPVPRKGRGQTVVPPSLRALGVTSREADVLELVAAALSNREIAARLYLSVKTIERHIANLFDRTGQRNRVALGELARRCGL